MKLYDFFRDLKNRKFFKEISIYAIAAWLTIQVAATVFPHIGLPAYWVTIVIILCLIGLPVWMIISWRYNIFDEDDTTELEKTAPTASFNLSKQFRQMIFGVTAAVVLMSIWIVWNNFIKKSYLISKEDKVAVAIFENLTGEQDFERFGRLISNYLTQGLTETNSVNVVSYHSIDNQSEILMQNNVIPQNEFSEAGLILAERNKANKLIKGNYFLQKDDLIILAEIISSETNVIEVSFSGIRCPAENPMECADQLRQKVLGFWAIKNNISRYRKVPNYDAYSELLKALEFSEIDYKKSMEHLDKAIHADSNFIQPYFYKLAMYINLNETDEAISLVNYLAGRRDEFSGYEKNQYLYFEALLNGDPLTAFKYFDLIYELDRQDIQQNMNAAYLALAFLNKPDKAIEILNYIEEDTIDYFKNHYVNIHRNILYARALVEKGEYSAADEVLNKIEVYETERIIRQIYIRSAVRQRNFKRVDQILEKSKTEELDHDYRYLYYSAAFECALAGDTIHQKKYAQKALNVYQETKPRSSTMIGRCLYLLEDWDRAELHEKQRLEKRPESIFSTARLAAINAYKGDDKQVELWLAKLDSLATSVNQKDIFYLKARTQSIMGEYEKAVQNLQASLENGQVFTLVNFHNDPEIKNHLPIVYLNQVLDYYH